MELSHSPKERRNRIIKTTLYVVLFTLATLMGVAVIYLYYDKLGF
jgi:hypothetical protein